MADLAYLPSQSKPKVHYHKSGWAEIKAQNGFYRQVRVKLPSLADIHAKQVFFFQQSSPLDLPVDSEREFDTFIVAHEGPPGAVAVCGFIFRFDQAPYVRQEFLESNAWSIVRGDSSYIAMDLRAFDIDSFLVVVPRISNEVAVGVNGVQIMAMCGTRENKSPYVYVINDRVGQVPTPMIFSERDLPRFPKDIQDRTQDRRRVERGIDGSVKYGDLV